jgi:hypothetical protein|tara:strand:- start:46 stop:1743 length:1698 start_codon:yes stop_codon:yes gene_type:complete
MDTHELESAIKDFKVFLKLTWEHLRLPAPTRMQYYIADYLQEGHKRSQLEALRGIGKTWITGAYVAWRLLRDPDEKILIVSQSGSHSDNISIFIRKLIDTMAILEHLQPRSDQRSSVIAFDVNGSNVSVQPSVKALGITSQLQGNRASLLISDDVEGQQNSATEKRRQDLLSQVAEYEAILQTTDNAQILVLGTPQSSESIYARLRDKGYVTRMYPARYPENVDSYQGCLAEYIVEDMANDPLLINKPIDSRFSEEDLYQRELSYGRSGFKLQFMIDTTLSDSEKYPLKTKDLIVTDMDSLDAPTKLIWSSHSHDSVQDIPNLGFSGDTFQRPSGQEAFGNYEGSVLAIDPSGRGQDEMGWAVVNHLLGKVFVPDFGGMNGGYEEANLIKLSEIAKKYKVNKVVIESNFGDGMFTNLMMPVLNAIYPVAIEEIRNNIQKEKRIIDSLEPLMNQHRLVFDYSALKRDIDFGLQEPKNIYYSLIYQLTHITKERGSIAHDDRLDALTLGVQFWNEYGILKQNSEISLSMYKKKQVTDELKRRANIFKGMQSKKSSSSASLQRLKAYR